MYDLEQLELSYAPPFGSAKDPVNMAGFTGSNILKGLVESVTYDQVETMGNALLLDVRRNEEFRADRIPQSVHMPLDELRERIQELPKDRPLIITCRTGVRSYAAYRILKQSGFSHLSNLSGGYISYCHYTNRTPSPDGQN